MNTPDHATDEQIAKLFDDELKPAVALNAAMQRLDVSMHKPVVDTTRRAYDIDVETVPSARADERYRAIDLNSFDGSPDGIGSFQGYGRTPWAAKEALMAKFAEYDAEHPAPRAGYVVHSSPFEPPTVIDVIDRSDEDNDR